MSRHVMKCLLSLPLALSMAALPGCYTQFGATEAESSEVPSVEEYAADSLETPRSETAAEDYESARYRFYFSMGYPYVGFGVSYGYVDPWYYYWPTYYWPAYAWYGYPYWYSGGYWPGYWYPPPGGWCCGYYPAYWYPTYTTYVSTRTFGTTRGYGSTRSGYGVYRGGTVASSRDFTPAYRPGTVSARTGATRTGATVGDSRSTRRVTESTRTRSSVSTGRRPAPQQYYRPPVQLQPRRVPEGDQATPRVGRRENAGNSSAGSSTRRSPSHSGGSRESYSPPAHSSPPPASRGSSGPSGGGSPSRGGSTRGSRR